jgi:hypothetical protein
MWLWSGSPHQVEVVGFEPLQSYVTGQWWPSGIRVVVAVDFTVRDATDVGHTPSQLSRILHGSRLHEVMLPADDVRYGRVCYDNDFYAPRERMTVGLPFLEEVDVRVVVQDTTVQCMATGNSSPPVRVSATTEFVPTQFFSQLSAYECLRVRTEMQLEVSSANELGASFEAAFVAALGVTDPSLVSFQYESGVSRRLLQASYRITTVQVAIKMIQQSQTDTQVLLDARTQAQGYAQSYLAGHLLAGLAGLPEGVLLLTIRDAPVVIYSENLYVPMNALIAFLTATLDPATAATDPSALSTRTARTVAFLQLAPELNAEELEEQFLNARREIFAYTRVLLSDTVHTDPLLVVDEDLEAVVELNQRLPDTYGALMMMQVAGADMPAAALVLALRQSVARSMGLATINVMMVEKYSSFTPVAHGAGTSDAVVVLVVPVHPDLRQMADSVVEHAEASLLSLLTEQAAVTACREPTMLWAATFHGDSSVYLPNTQMESDTVMAEVPLDGLAQDAATAALAGDIAAAVAAVALRPASDVEVAFLLDSDSNTVSVHLIIRYPLIELERATVQSTAIAMASALRHDATPILRAVPILDAPSYTSEWVHFFRGKEYVLRMRLQLPRVRAAQVADAAWVASASAALELSLATAVGQPASDVLVTNWTAAAVGSGVTVDVLMADSQSHFNQHVTAVATTLSPVDQLARLAETDMDALLDASLPGMRSELQQAYPVFVSTGDLHALPPPTVAAAAAAAGNVTLSFGATVTNSAVQWGDLDTTLLGEVLLRRLAAQGGVDVASVQVDWSTDSSSHCAAAQSVTMSVTAVQYPGCASVPLAVWADHTRVRPGLLFAPVAAPFSDERVRALDTTLSNLTFQATWVTTVWIRPHLPCT